MHSVDSRELRQRRASVACREGFGKRNGPQTHCRSRGSSSSSAVFSALVLASALHLLLSPPAPSRPAFAINPAKSSCSSSTATCPSSQ